MVDQVPAALPTCLIPHIDRLKTQAGQRGVCQAWWRCQVQQQHIEACPCKRMAQPLPHVACAPGDNCLGPGHATCTATTAVIRLHQYPQLLQAFMHRQRPAGGLWQPWRRRQTAPAP